MDRLRGKVILISGGAHSRAACRSIIWEIWALSVDDREVDSVVVDEGETDELASEVRIGLSAGGRWIRTSGSAQARPTPGSALALHLGSLTLRRRDPDWNATKRRRGSERRASTAAE